MDSSPDLSLKLRRGSSDSRDSFYMDFAQGIDSDIEEVETIAAGGASGSGISRRLQQQAEEQQREEQQQNHHHQQQLNFKTSAAPGSTSASQQSLVSTSTTTPPIDVPPPMALLPTTTSSGRITPPPLPLPPVPLSPLHSALRMPLENSSIHDALPHPPSPSSPNRICMSPESLSHHSSPARSGKVKIRPQHVTILDETTTIINGMPMAGSTTPMSPTSVIAVGLPLAGSSQNLLLTSASAAVGSSGPLLSSSPSAAVSPSTTATAPPTTASTSISPSAADSGSNSGGALALLYQHQHSVQQHSGGSATSATTVAHHQHHHHHHLHPILPVVRRPSRPPETIYVSRMPEIKAGDALATTFSALYGKLLVVMGIAFPMAEVISTYIPPSFYEVFYLYLYIGSMLFLFFMYATLIWGKPKLPKPPKPLYRAKTTSKTHNTSTDDLESMGHESDTESHTSSECRRRPPMRRPSILATMAGGGRGHYGSFYLRMGAVAFGIGSMIYSGLEFGQYFELERDTKCHNVLLALTPATRMAFIFIQMYFIFLNNEQMKVYRHKIIARFGLMHMIGTNLSVWLNVLIQETKHEILTFYNPENRTLRISHRLGNKLAQHAIETETAHLRIARGLKGPHHIFECRRTNIIGTLVQDASPFLFPCTIEYSLICAAILYVMWRGICRPEPLPQPPMARVDSPTGHSPCKRSPHHYSVDCARAHKGLFIGILILVLTIISLILFFVLISRPEFVSLAVTEVTICELTIYGTATIATLIGMVQVRHMQYDAYRSFQLDDILLVGAQTGLFLYSTFTVIGGHFTLRRDTVLVLITALASIVQTACQTMFILDASRRNAATADHMRRKPGREIVTFLLVANLAMWAISTLEKSRAESHPIQLNFYGLWAWTIITHVSMPLAIFYRFHSTVCLCEIWKRAYKMKPSYC